MTITEKILAGIKQAITEGGTVNIDLKEASAITGSGSGVGGRAVFDDAFAALRYANPFRMGSRVIPVAGSDAQFVAKTGNATYQTNPWGYPVQDNTGTPSTDTSIWQLPVRVVTAQLPIRSAVLSDVNGLESTIVEDLALEFSQVEAASMAVNNDQAGSTTTATGATSGLRGLDMYESGASAAYGTSGTSITNGIHTIATIGSGGGGGGTSYTFSGSNNDWTYANFGNTSPATQIDFGDTPGTLHDLLTAGSVAVGTQITVTGMGSGVVETTSEFTLTGGVWTASVSIVSGDPFGAIIEASFTVSGGGGTVTYDTIVDVVNAFPSQYWSLPGNAWHIRPSMIESLRKLVDLQGLPLFLEVGDEDGAAVGRMFGFPVIPNPYLSETFPIYLANWPRFLTIGDTEEMSIQMMDQTTPGFVTLYAEKRVVSSVRDPFAGVRMSA